MTVLERPKRHPWTETEIIKIGTRTQLRRSEEHPCHLILLGHHTREGLGRLQLERKYNILRTTKVSELPFIPTS